MCSLSQHWTCVQRALLHLPEEVFPAGLTARHEQFIWLLEMVPISQFVQRPRFGWPGRPAKDQRCVLRAFLAKALLNLPTTRALIDRLQVDRTLRQLCGWERAQQVPSEAVFSRSFDAFARTRVLDKIHAHLVAAHLGEVVVFHVSRDSTAIEVREKAQPPPDKPTKAPDAPPKKRGRPRKDEPPRVPPETRLERQLRTPCAQTAELLAELPTQCCLGSKKDSKGKVMHWKGLKFHVDVADEGVPLLCVTTAAALHDSQVAIPMARTTSQRVTHLYELMDSAYDAEEIHAAVRALDRVPIIDHNPRRLGHAAKVPLEPDRARRYCARSGSERFNSLLKDSHGGRTVRVRGSKKVHAHLMSGVVVIFAAILQGWATSDPA